jgi:hypothetical protein
MQAIINRLPRLKDLTVPAERQRGAVKAILEARCRRWGDDYKPTNILPLVP